jgi:hypothetical protein
MKTERPIEPPTTNKIRGPPIEAPIFLDITAEVGPNVELVDGRVCRLLV